MPAFQRRLRLHLTTLLASTIILACSQSAPSPSSGAIVPSPPPATEPAKRIVLTLTPERLAALPPLAKKSPMVFGQAPNSSYNWRFGSTEDEMMVWAGFEPAWSVAEFSNVIVTSGYIIESDLAPELDLVSAILGMERSEVEKKIIPREVIGGRKVEVFGTGEFTTNGLVVHYAFEDNSGVNGHHKPDLMVAILPETYHAFSIEQGRKQKNGAKP